MALPEDFLVVRERARPLAPEERREAILVRVLPLLRERGKDVTSRELAEAAGVAEGTLFRAFGDKESLLAAGLEQLLDRKAFLGELRSIPDELPLDDKLAAIIELLQVRFRDVFRILTLFQVQTPPPNRDESREELLDIVRELLEPHMLRIAVPVELLAWYLRLVAFGSSIEPFNHPRPFDADELAALVAHGVTFPDPPQNRKKPSCSAESSSAI